MAIERTFVGLPAPDLDRAGSGGHPCQGLYYAPAGVRPSVAVIATHYQVDFSEHYMAEHLAARGIGFLGWNTRFRGDESHFVLDRALVDIGVGVRWLREIAGAEVVVLLGNSGGGSLMAAYQSQAVEPNVTPPAGMALAAGAEELPAADGYVSTAAHRGRPDVLTAWMDGAVTDETDPLATDPSLDLFNPENGPPYGKDFLDRYRAAQTARNHRITDWVKAELARLTAAQYYDRPFSVFRTWADPRMVDPALEPSRRRPNSCYAGKPALANRTAWGIATACTLRGWLNMWSLSESQTRAHPHLARITVPSLVVNADADTGVFPSDADGLYEALAAADKQRHDLHADHYFQDPPGARDELSDLIASWIHKRFG